ncbi:MAG: family 1 glycosylhydrolase [Pseudomonadota bacterium]
MIDRRTILTGAAAAAALTAAPSLAQSVGQSPRRRMFPDEFIWGAATAGHQVEGNDTASDTWLLGTVSPTVFREPVRDAANSFNLWPVDLDLCVALGLNAYRFSVEWSRIEPERGLISQAMIDHYKRMVEGCHQRGLKPIVTLSHFTAPRWFAAAGGWTAADAPDLFAAQCEGVIRAMGDGIDHAVTFNEPNLFRLIEGILPPEIHALERATLDAAGAATGSAHFVAGNVVRPEDGAAIEANMMIGHRRAREAIKAVRGDLPVGLSLAIIDEQALPGGEALRDATRAQLYDPWLAVARDDDFVGVQNYERRIWGADGRVPAPESAPRGQTGQEIDALSLANTVRYAHGRAQVPIMVTEHGVNTEDDALRAWLIPEALRGLHDVMAEGVPVTGYCHWSLIDNFEWIFGYGPKLGLHSVDPVTFRRTPKLSAVVYEGIVRANGL